jgi:malate dehydrogenase
MPAKISIIGAGNVGAACAQRIAEKGYADVVLVDIVPGLAQGKALDISQSAPIIGFDTKIIGTDGYEETAGSQVVIVTAGLFRKPGMTRDELMLANMKIVSEVTSKAVSYSPNCVIIMVANPVDAMTYLAIKTSQFPRNRVIGLSGVLDGARLSSFIAAELKVSPADVSPCILGPHRTNMLVIPRLTTVKGKPVTKLLPKETVDRLVQRAIEGGAEIVALLKTGSAFYAPSAAAARMAEAIIKGKKETLLCAAYLDGEYGIKDTVIGVPVRLGKKGIDKIIELKLTKEEKQELAKSAETVKELIKTMGLG